MSSKCNLHIDWCTYDAAKFAVIHWHYSKRMPAGKLVKFGVWEDGQFVGTVIYGLGATFNIGTPYGLNMTEVCELVRVALTTHTTPVSRILSITMKMLKKHMSGIRLVISYADSEQGHLGGIYKASNWIYTGASRDTSIVVNGITEHRRTLSTRYGTSSLSWICDNVDPGAYKKYDGDKYKYIYPLDNEIKEQVKSLSKPYPQTTSASSINSIMRSASSRKKGGAAPTLALNEHG